MSNNPPVRIKLLHDDASLPHRSTDGAIGYDLRAYARSETGRTLSLAIPPRSTRHFSCGFALELPPGIWAGVYSRSGLARDSIFVANSPGVIDTDYRGEVGVLLYNGGSEPFYVQHGHRIAQLIFHRVCDVQLQLAKILTETTRGERGYGSTGIA